MEAENESEIVRKQGRATRIFKVWRKLKQSKSALVGCMIVLIVCIVALLAPLISPMAPSQVNVSNRLAPPSFSHLLGTDNLGRDVLSWVIWGSRIAVMTGVVSTTIAVSIAVMLGLVSGYYGGLIDELMMRITDVFLSLPTLILLIVAVSMVRIRSQVAIALIMAIVAWPWMARVVRGECLRIKRLKFIEAAKTMGASDRHIIFRHILPNLLSIVIVMATIEIPFFILWEATLLFLGFGDPNSTSWGVIINFGKNQIRSAPWVVTFPGLAIFFTSFGFNLLGDGLRDALDVETEIKPEV